MPWAVSTIAYAASVEKICVDVVIPNIQRRILLARDASASY
jgi:hypothetical protein